MWNPEKWKFAQGITPQGDWNHLDTRHCRFVYDLVMAGDFVNVLEIGTDKGWVTSALVQAHLDGKTFGFCSCDLVITEELCEVLKRDTTANRHQAFMGDSIGRIYLGDDLVILDGAHDIEQVSREIGLLLYHRIPTIIAHDVMSGASKTAPAGMQGSVFLREVFQAHPAYRCRHDAVARDGERTYRGLLLATRSGKVWEQSEKPWQEMLT